MMVKGISERKQNVDVISDNNTTDEDDEDDFTLERELPRYLKNIIHRVFEVPEKDRDKDCGVVPMVDWAIVSQLEELVDSGRGKPERLRHLISKYYQQTGNVQFALKEAKEAYEQEMKDLDGIGHEDPGLEDKGTGIEELER